MPTFDIEEGFRQEYLRLQIQKRAAFLNARDDFFAWRVAKEHQPNLAPPAHLRLHFIDSKNAWSITFVGDLRALWRYGQEIRPGEPHIVWLSIGSHDVYGAR
jgi:hypothetical protein